MRTAYYSKSMKSYDSLGLTHIVNEKEDGTLCGKKFNQRWIIDESICNCSQCLKKLETTHNSSYTATSLTTLRQNHWNDNAFIYMASCNLRNFV